LTLLFSERNHFCPYCQVSGGDCELQNAAYEQDMTHWPLQPNWNKYDLDASHEYFILEQDRCILCRRCVRACGELIGNFTLGVEERGADSSIVADLGVPLGESTCISCGACVQVCPTGALIDKKSAYLGHEVQLDKTESICIGCSLGCGIDIYSRDNRLVRIEGNWDASVNHGVLCKVGRYLPHEAENWDRIYTPMVRKDGKLKAATWEDAINAVADQLKQSSRTAAMASTRLPAESLYLFKQLFGDKLQADTVTSIEEGANTKLAAQLAADLGSPFEGSLSELEKADCVLVLGADLVEDHEVASFFIKRNVPHGTRVISAGCAENAIADIADVVLKPSGDNYDNLIQALSAALADKPVTALAKAAGVDEAAVKEAARILAAANFPAIVYGEALLKNASLNTLKALVELGHLSGAIGEQRNALVSVKGKANSMAAAQYGLEQAMEISDEQAVFIALGDDCPSQKLIKRLENVPFIAVQASYSSQLTAHANVVLPVTDWTEQEGSYLNLDGRLQTAVQPIAAPEGVLTNAAVLEKLAAALGYHLDAAGWKDELLKRVPVAIITE
ncbi:MAG: molybdopterin-dependent oxidoreductase, partial [Anaerolineaceae bacterium]|nr:molybdopterin-dependent oxidoreductase [Anaerolineaceae bacterium]